MLSSSTYVKTKCFILLFLMVFISSTTQAAVLMQQPLLSAVEICRQETGATEADFDALLKKSKPSMAAKCMRACLMKQFDMMDSDGKFNRDVAIRIVSEFASNDSEKMRLATEIVDTCYATMVSDNHCEAAEQYSKCANTHAQGRVIRQNRSLPKDDGIQK